MAQATKQAPDNQVNLAEEIRRQNRKKKRKRRIGILCVVLLIIAYLAGVFSAILSFAENLSESATIAFATQAGFPVQTGISELYQVQELSGGFVALGAESCVVYSSGGNRLRSVQSAYLRPAIAVGGNRYLLYQRAGNELRVESRTQTLYNKTYSNNILLATISQNGSVAVATEDDRYFAAITMHTPTMEKKMTYYMTETEGIPIQMAYAPDNTNLAVATISAQNGQMLSQVYLLSAKQESIWLDSAVGKTPMALEWISKTTLLVLYDDHVVCFDTATNTKSVPYEYTGQMLIDYDWHDGTLALLLGQGTQTNFVLLDATLATISQGGSDATATQVVLGEEQVYLVSEKAIITCSTTGNYLDIYQSEQKILSLCRTDQLLLFTANETKIFTPPVIIAETEGG